MNVTFLGTGTSTGVPVIGCDCAVCRSTDARDRRRRASVYVVVGGQHIVIDTPPDFRDQVLTFGVPRVDALLITHSHADHIFGFDDIRRFNVIQDAVIPVYAGRETLADLKRIFDYTQMANDSGGFQPRVAYCELEVPTVIGGVEVTPLPVEHGSKATRGYALSDGVCRLGYVPDCHHMPDATVAALQGVDVMILNALRRQPHATHLSLRESLSLLRRIGAKRSYLIHMGHDFGHAATEAELPEGVRLSYDGLVVDVSGV